MDLKEKLQWLEARKGSNHTLEQFRNFLDENLGPVPYPTIQVAGTNGKGSTIQWMETMADRKKVGTFTSPHLESHFERMAINGKPIDEKSWEALFDKDLFEKHGLTMFEADLYMALAWFRQEGVDLALLETGLGGARDAVTALDHVAAGITNIGFDHMELLGNTLEEIALEKEAVLKDIPCATTEEDMFSILKEKAPQLVQVKGQEPVPGLPAYQAKNKALAKKLLELADIPLKQEPAPFFWPARYETLRKSPLLLLDGAHNLPGIQALVEERPPVNHIYFSVLKEKQAWEMIAQLETLGVPITLVRFDDARLADLDQFSLPVLSFSEMMETLKTTREPVLVCGSLHFAGKVRQAFLHE